MHIIDKKNMKNKNTNEIENSHKMKEKILSNEITKSSFKIM